MGNDYSSYVNEAEKISENVCVLCAVSYYIYGINLPEDIVNGIQEVYTNVWEHPMKKVKHHNCNIIRFSAHKLMMCNGDSAKNSAKAKQMFCRFHKLFCANGWSLINSPTLTFQYTLSSWFYHKEINPYMIDTGSVDNEFCAISLSGYDRLQFVDLPTDLESDLINCIQKNWHKGVKERESIEGTKDCWTIQMNGYPWKSKGKESLDARFLVLTLIRFMSHKNWRLVNSTAMKPDASDTMFFRNFSKAFNFECPESMPEYYFMLALMGKNYFGVLGVNEDIQNAIANSCSKNEEKGVKSVQMKNNYPAIIMHSDIWSRKDIDALYTKRLMTLIFQDLAAIGWLPVESIDCTRSIKDLSSIAFVNIPPNRIMFFSLSPQKFNAVALVNCPPEIQQLICDTFIRTYPIKKENVKLTDEGIAAKIHLSGDPFSGMRDFGYLLFQQSLALVIVALKDAGWNLILSADTSNETKNTGGKSNNTIKFSIYSLWFGKVIID